MPVPSVQEVGTKLKEATSERKVIEMFRDYVADGMDTESAALAVARGTDLDLEEVDAILKKHGLLEKDMRKKEENNQDYIIEIPEDVKIPGTDIMLEKGDRIRVNLREGPEKAIALIQDYARAGDPFDIGVSVGAAIIEALTQYYNGDRQLMIELIEGISQEFTDWWA